MTYGLALGEKGLTDSFLTQVVGKLEIVKNVNNMLGAGWGT